MQSNLLMFERFTLSSLVIGIVVAALQIQTLANDPGTAFGIAAFQVIILLVILTLVLLISRKQSKFAKWAWVIFFVLGLIAYIPILSEMLANGIQGILSVLQLLLQCIGMYFLFSKPK